MNQRERSRIDILGAAASRAALLASLALSACGGGGSGGSPPPPPPPPPPPTTAENVCTSTAAGQTLTGTLPGSGSGAMYQAAGVAPTKGTVTIDVAGNFMYTPRTNLSSGDGRARGMDQFGYRLTDRNGQTSDAVVTVMIDGAVRIMPLGDSITAGVSAAGSPNELPIDQQVSYRRKLFNDLEALSTSYGINFVGSLNAEGSAANPPLADRDHEGHPGWCDDNNPQCAISGGQTIDGNITSILNANPPDMILLHIGTNEFSVDASGVNSILNKISTWAQSNYPVEVFLARIIPTTDGHLDVNTFNNNVAAIANDRPGEKVVVVDQQAELHSPNDPDPNKADLSLMAATAADTLHPNQTGYDRMADRWRADIVASGVLPTCN